MNGIPRQSDVYDVNAIEAAMSANPAGVHHLVNDLCSYGREVVVPSRRRSRWTVSALAVAAAVAVVAAGTGTAQAAVVPITSPVRVVISSQTARVDFTAVSTASEFRDGGHCLITTVDGSTMYSTSRSGGVGPQVVHVDGIVPSVSLTPGKSSIKVTDVGDGRSRLVPVQVVRQSVVSVAAYGYPGGISVVGTASHYDARTGTYQGDQASPVLLQAWHAGRWVTAEVLQTAPDGSVAAVLPAVGTGSVRLVRPVGVTVTGGTSNVVTVTALPMLAANGGPTDY